jgi:hypothetical protein
MPSAVKAVLVLILQNLPEIIRAVRGGSITPELEARAKRLALDALYDQAHKP